jgi:hypothetical protein
MSSSNMNAATKSAVKFPRNRCQCVQGHPDPLDQQDGPRR